MFNWLRKNKAVSYPNPDDWSSGTPDQIERLKRSYSELRKRKVPVYGGPLFVEDQSEVVGQSHQDVARRALILFAVELQAEGVSRDETHSILDTLELWEFVSPKEKEFLFNENPDPLESQKLVWRLESIWVLMWALGYIEELGWPSGMCDVPKLVGLLEPHEKSTEFITKAALRSISDLLDAQDLTMRIHWAIRDAYLHHQGIIPEDLDWSGKSNSVLVTESAVTGVIEQRHYVLNWLLNFLSPEDWDSVDTPT